MRPGSDAHAAGRRRPRHPTPAAVRRRPLLALALALALAAPQTARGAEAESLAGRSLTDALLELRARGLKIVFSSSLVRPGMRVEREPSATAPRQILDELLAPHGLASRDGPEETVVVVPAAALEPPAAAPTIRGSVRSAVDGTPLPGARVRLLGSGHETTAGAGGEFELALPSAGRLTLEAEAPGFLASRLALDARDGAPAPTAAISLEPAPVIAEQMVVTPSRVSLLRQEPAAPLGLTRDEILALPHLGDDFFRALSLLPGVAANDVSAQFHVRGGRRDETMILIDGQELYDAYHLQDFDSALSLIAPATLDAADLSTGGFSAEYGDRMSGVLDMTTLTPRGGARYRLGASALSAHFGTSGTFRRQRGRWIAEVRRGSDDLVGRLIGDQNPKYWDAFAKLELDLDERHSLRGNVLHSGDRLDFEQLVDGEVNRLQTEYDSSYLWLTHQAVAGRSLLIETAASSSRFDRDRSGVELEEDSRFTILDRRRVEVADLRQAGNLLLTPRHRLLGGWTLRRFDAAYDYFGVHDLDHPLARIRHDFGLEQTEFTGRFAERHASLYLADRMRLLEELTLELGLRYDRHTLTDESHLSPRLNVAWAPGERGVLRFAWGRFNQSQRPYELQVEDGERRFYPVERSEHRVLGYETRFETDSPIGALALRVELYQRVVTNPRRRYENLFEPINSFPEVEPDRVRIEPERSRAEGLELFLRGRLGRRIDWFANYALASTRDRVDGDWIDRLFDQTHSFNLIFDFRIGEQWRLDLAWRYHTGWPTTPVALVDTADGGAVPEIGRVNSDRLPAYHRLDLRASRSWRLRSVGIDLFVDVQNLYNRDNVGGFDIEIDEASRQLVRRPENWAGLLPSAGVSVEF